MLKSQRCGRGTLPRKQALNVEKALCGDAASLLGGQPDGAPDAPGRLLGHADRSLAALPPADRPWCRRRPRWPVLLEASRQRSFSSVRQLSPRTPSEGTAASASRKHHHRMLRTSHWVSGHEGSDVLGAGGLPGQLCSGGPVSDRTHTQRHTHTQHALHMHGHTHTRRHMHTHARAAHT